MKYQSFEWKDQKSRKIFGQYWLPETAVQAIICNVHGQGEHSSRYDHVAEFFVKHSIAFFTADLPGHGKSGGARGHINKFEEYTDVVDKLIQEAKKLFPQAALFIYGHSMGGNIALNHAMHTNEKIAGYMITSPWIHLAFEPPAWKVTLGKTVKNIFPALQQATGLDVSKISRDKLEVKKYSEDALNHNKISASAFFEVLTHGKNILLQADKLKFPILLMHGSADDITSHHASKELAMCRKDMIQFHEFEGAYHELHHEFEKQKLLDTMLSFITSKVQSSQ